MSIYEDSVAKMREYFVSGDTLNLAHRTIALKKLYDAIVKNTEAIEEALLVDLGKHPIEGYMSEIGLCLTEIRYMLKNLRYLAIPRKVKTPLMHFPSKSKIYPEPKGVVLIIAPFNYPFQLTIVPLIDALASGNCVVLKPSRYSVRTSAVIKAIIAEIFDDNFVTTFEGGADVNTALLDCKFDHIFFTGGKTVGRVVLEKASKFLTPVSLELGGKSPCIVEKTANLAITAQRIIWGKFLNSGQTCVCPDYLLVQQDVLPQLLPFLKDAILEFYGETPLKSNSYGSIISEKHFDRISAYLSCGEIIAGGQTDRERLKIAPTLMFNPPLDSAVMQEEIFGPLLPIIPFDTLDNAIKLISSREKPLALYLFTTDKAVKKEVVRRVSFGGGCINDTIIHLTNHHMPFGGVGESGMGAYHGDFGFATFSHYKSILEKSASVEICLRYPPYTEKKLKAIKKFM